MAEIIKTWPAWAEARKVAQMFSAKTSCFARYYFILGRGKPALPITRIWYTWRGRILGSFEVAEIVCNVGQIPKLWSLSGEESEWQIPKDRYVAICIVGCERLKERIFMSGFRGWRYFDLESYRSTSESRHRL